MERLEEVKDFSEAEKFLAYCLKHFPQDGYFIKYKGDLLWKKVFRMKPWKSTHLQEKPPTMELCILSWISSFRTKKHRSFPSAENFWKHVISPRHLFTWNSGKITAGGYRNRRSILSSKGICCAHKSGA